MLHNLTEESWKRALEQNQKLRQLAVKAGVEDNFERAKELNGCFAWNCGDGVVKSEEERNLAQYLFILDDSDSYKDALKGRIAAARAAGIGINDL